MPKAPLWRVAFGIVADARNPALPPAVERTTQFLIAEGHPPEPALAMAVNLIGDVPRPLRESTRRWRTLKMTPDECERFAWTLQNRRVLIEGVLMSLDGEDVRDGTVLSANALMEAHTAKRPVRMTIGGARATSEQIGAARARLKGEQDLLDTLMEAATKAWKPPELLKEGVGGGKPHARVAHLQNKLNSMGHRVACDGVFGPVTAEAVKDFQAKGGIPTTGEVDDRTMDALRHGRVMNVSAPAALLPTQAEQALKDIADGNPQKEVDSDGSAPSATEKEKAKSQGGTNDKKPSKTISLKVDLGEAHIQVCATCGAPAKPGAKGVCMRGHRLGAPTKFKLSGPVQEAHMGASPFKKGDHVDYQHGYYGKVGAHVTKVTKSRVHVESSDSRVGPTSFTHNQAAVKLTKHLRESVELQGSSLPWNKAPGGKRYEFNRQGHHMQVVKQNTAAGGPRWKAYHTNPAKVTRIVGKGDDFKAVRGQAEQHFHGLGLKESAKTAALSVTPSPFSTSKTSNWVARAGGLPPYVQNIAKAIQRDGKTESEAISIAIGRCKDWAAGGGGVSAEVKAAAAKAIAQWEKMKGSTNVKKISESALDLQEDWRSWDAKRPHDQLVTHLQQWGDRGSMNFHGSSVRIEHNPASGFVVKNRTGGFYQTRDPHDAAVRAMKFHQREQSATPRTHAGSLKQLWDKRVGVMQQADSRGDLPESGMLVGCPKCGAPVAKGICQRGHRVKSA